MRDTETKLSVFYGYSAELIASWCGVSIAVAKAYKLGVRKPSRQSLRLFTLYRQERVLGPEWANFRVTRNCIVDPAGNVTTSVQLESYALVMQWAAHVASQDPERHRAFYELLRRA